MAKRTVGGRRWQAATPDPEAMLDRLRLTTGRAARICGVTRRQLCYWTDQGIIEALPPDGEADGEDGDSGQRTYDCNALRRVLLLKQSLARGCSVRRAAKEADTHLEDNTRREEMLRGCSPEERQPFLADQAQQLDAMAARLRDLVASGNRNGLVALAAEVEALGGACRRILSDGIALHEDVDGCLALAGHLDRLDAVLAGADEEP